MAFYSKIATLKYEDRELKVKIPIRVKIAEFKRWSDCKDKCYEKHATKHSKVRHDYSSLNEVEWYYNREGLGKAEHEKGGYRDVVYFKGGHYPAKMFRGETVLCPFCRLALPEFKEEKLKVYTSKKSRYVAVGEILFENMAFQWRHVGVSNNTYNGTDTRCFADSLEDIYQRLEDTKRLYIKKDKRLKLKVYKGLTMDTLKKELKHYKGRRIIKAL